MKSTEYTRILEHALRPEISVPAVYLLFIVFAFVSYNLPETGKYLLKPHGPFLKPELLSYGIAVLSILILSGSALLGKRISIKTKMILIPAFVVAFLALYLTFDVPLIAVLAASGGYVLLLFFISKKLDDVNITWVAMSIATTASVSVLYRGGSLLGAISRETIAIDPSRAIFHGFAVIGATFLIAFYRKRTAIYGILFLLTLSLLSGFKSDAIAVIASASIAGLLLRRITLKEIGAGLLVVILILTLVGTHIAEITYATWNIPKAYYIFYRAGLTFAVFDKIVGLGFPFGYLHGATLLDATQMVISVNVLPEIYAVPRIITSTLIGPGMLDFGIPGAFAIAFFTGIYLGIMDRMRKSTIQTCLYAIALTHTFILIEVGLQLTSILFYLSLLYLGISYQKVKLVDVG